MRTQLVVLRGGQTKCLTSDGNKKETALCAETIEIILEWSAP